MQPNLLPYQQCAKDFALNTPYCGLFLDCGLGKTLITLSVIDELIKNHKLSGHVLIIAPKNIARSTWVDEIRKWDFDFRYKSLLVDEKGKELSKKKREQLYLEALNAPQTIYFINRELIPSMINFYVDRTVKPYGRYNFTQGWIFKMIVIDELQSFKSYKSQRFNALKTIMPDVMKFIGLTGTPTPNGLEDLWSEIYLMDRGLRLGKNITTYRNAFFNPGMIANGYPVKYIPKRGAEQEIYNRVKDIVISMKNTHLNLPPITYNDVYVYMSDDEYDLYKSFAKEKILDIDEDIQIVASNAAILTAKLSQMASGAIYLPDETNKKSDIAAYQVIHERKLEQLGYIIQNTDSPVLVAYHFKSDKDMICRYLNASKNSPNAVVFDGSPEMLSEWNQGKIPVLLIQPASAGHGLNFQEGGHTLIWYTISWSLEEYIQTISRLQRQGQTKPVIVHHIMTAKTIDKRILNNVLEKDADEQNLLEAIRLTIDELT